MTNLSTASTKFQVKVGNRVVSEEFSRFAAEVALSNLSESERANASIVPVAANGNTVLLG